MEKLISTAAARRDRAAQRTFSIQMIRAKESGLELNAGSGQKNGWSFADDRPGLGGVGNKER